MFTRVVNRKNNRKYLYLERRYREGGQVRSESRCLGPIHVGRPSAGDDEGWLRRQFPKSYGLDWDAIEREMVARADREQERANEFAAKMHAEYGMRLDTPATPV